MLGTNLCGPQKLIWTPAKLIVYCSCKNPPIIVTSCYNRRLRRITGRDLGIISGQHRLLIRTPWCECQAIGIPRTRTVTISWNQCVGSCRPAHAIGRMFCACDGRSKVRLRKKGGGGPHGGLHVDPKAPCVLVWSERRSWGYRRQEPSALISSSLGCSPGECGVTGDALPPMHNLGDRRWCEVRLECRVRYVTRDCDPDPFEPLSLLRVCSVLVLFIHAYDLRALMDTRRHRPWLLY
jgi:hypothetical protein